MREIAGAFGYNEIGVWVTAGGYARKTYRLYASHRKYPDTWKWVRKVWWRGYWIYGGMWPYSDRIEVLRDERTKFRSRCRHDNKITYKWRYKRPSGYARREAAPEGEK